MLQTVLHQQSRIIPERWVYRCYIEQGTNLGVHQAGASARWSCSELLRSAPQVYLGVVRTHLSIKLEEVPEERFHLYEDLYEPLVRNHFSSENTALRSESSLKATMFALLANHKCNLLSHFQRCVLSVSSSDNDVFL